MPNGFKPCPLDSNDGFKREHVELSPSMWNYERIISTTIMPMATKLGKVVTYHEWLPPIKSHDSLIT